MRQGKVEYPMGYGALAVSWLRFVVATRVRRGVRAIAILGAFSSLLAACGSSRQPIQPGVETPPTPAARPRAALHRPR